MSWVYCFRGVCGKSPALDRRVGFFYKDKDVSKHAKDVIWLQNLDDTHTLRMLKTTRAMFFLNGLVWLVFSILSSSQAINGTSSWRSILSMLMLINAVVFLGFGFLIRNGQLRIFFLAILYVAVNVVLSITDQFGWFDFLIMLLNLILLGLIFVTRQRMKELA